MSSVNFFCGVIPNSFFLQTHILRLWFFFLQNIGDSGEKAVKLVDSGGWLGGGVLTFSDLRA